MLKRPYHRLFSGLPRLLLDLLLLASFVIPACGVAPEEPARATLKRAQSLLRSGPSDPAIPLFRQVLQNQPHNDSARFGLAVALILSREQSVTAYRKGLREARVLLESSVSLLSPIPGQSKETALRLYYLGLAYWYLDQGDLALSSFDRSFRLDPTLLPALYNSIRVAEELGRLDEATRRKQTYAGIATP